MSEQVKILWVRDQYFGPVNGLAQYQGNKVWFRRVEDEYTRPKERSSNDYNNEDKIYPDVKKYSFELLQLDESILAGVEADHEEYCKLTGMAAQYGEAHKINLPAQVEPKEEENKWRGLGRVAVHKFKYNPQQIQGKVIAKIQAEQISNYLVAHEVKK
jgi:hypothetical protein